MNSKYFMPTRIMMGSGCISNNCEMFKALGKKALIVTGANSAKINGSEKEVKDALDSVGISCLVFDRVMSNPTIACIYEGADTARKNNVDFIVAIGGGSPMDAAKGIALLAAQEIPEEKLFSGDYENEVLPMAFIPTTAGTGSEVTQYSILTNDREQTKTSIATELLFPEIAFLEPRYMEKLSVATTINTAVDALSHSVEGLLSVRSSMISDALAYQSIRMIMDCVPDMLGALESSSDYGFSAKVREILLHASCMAGMVIAQTGTTVVHAMGYSLTYFRGIEHGRANGLLLAGYLRLVQQEKPDLAAKILEAMKLSDINQFKDLMNKLLGEKEGIDPDEINKYSSMAIMTKNISNCVVKPDEEDIKGIYSVSFTG